MVLELSGRTWTFLGADPGSAGEKQGDIEVKDMFAFPRPSPRSNVESPVRKQIQVTLRPLFKGASALFLFALQEQTRTKRGVQNSNSQLK